MSKENHVSSKQPVTYSATATTSPSSSAKSSKFKSNADKWASSTEPLRKQIISNLVIAKSPRVSLHPIRLKSKANALFGRVILDSVVEPLFATCLACKKVLHFKNSHNGAGNLKRHLRNCAANRKRTSFLHETNEERSRSTSKKGHRKRKTTLDEWFNKNRRDSSNKLLQVYSPSASSDSSDTSC